MIDFSSKIFYNFDDLLAIMRVLRGEGGCPWDREQTHDSIRRNFIEEVYEACEAIDLKDNALLKEELGDVLLQVVFHSAMAEDEGAFNINDVCDGICKKLIFRHPHIFGEASASNSKEVLELWDEVKRKEKGQDTYTQSMEQVAKSLPALIYAEKVQGKAKKAGFDWPEVAGALGKIEEETAELKAAIACGGNVEEELGDLLFSVVNVARFQRVDPEEALAKAAAKFMSRFAKVEKLAGDKLKDMSLEEMDKLWEQVKEE